MWLCLRLRIYYYVEVCGLCRACVPSTTTTAPIPSGLSMRSTAGSWARRKRWRWNSRASNSRNMRRSRRIEVIYTFSNHRCKFCQGPCRFFTDFTKAVDIIYKLFKSKSNLQIYVFCLWKTSIWCPLFSDNIYWNNTIRRRSYPFGKNKNTQIIPFADVLTLFGKNKNGVYFAIFTRRITFQL